MGNMLISTLFNGASITIPDGERFVIRAAEDALPHCSPELKKIAAHLMEEEAAHAKVHDAYNMYLRDRGYPVDRYVEKAKRATHFSNHHASLLTRLAICAAIEHLTAISSRQALENKFFEREDVDPRMKRVWMWHATEELDHRSSAFDLYQALGGGYVRRIYAALLIGVFLFYIHVACIGALLKQEHMLWNWRAWKAASPYLFGKRGIYAHFIPDLLFYYVPNFHPSKLPLSHKLQERLQHYPIESELAEYFTTGI